MDTETVNLPFFHLIKDQAEFDKCFVVFPNRFGGESLKPLMMSEVQNPNRWECNKRNGY